MEFSQQPYEVGVISPILQIVKLRHREGMRLGPGYTGNSWKSEGNWNPVLLIHNLVHSPSPL